jgi:hypothetical protein
MSSSLASATGKSEFPPHSRLSCVSQSGAAAAYGPHFTPGGCHIGCMDIIILAATN